MKVNDPRWADYTETMPPESNANYAWILHMLSHLKTTNGVAGFLLANGALSDTDGTAYEIRKNLIEKDKVEAIIVLPRELFFTTDISVTFWILNQNKKGGIYHGRSLRNREHEILFTDLRTWTENSVKNQNKKKVILSANDSVDEIDVKINLTGQIEKAASIYHKWQETGTDGSKYATPELYRSVKVYNSQLTEEEKNNGVTTIESMDFTLTPSKYIEFIDHDLDINYEVEMNRIQNEMKSILINEKKSQQLLVDAFRGIGYEIDKD